MAPGMRGRNDDHRGRPQSYTASHRRRRLQVRGVREANSDNQTEHSGVPCSRVRPRLMGEPMQSHLSRTIPDRSKTGIFLARAGTISATRHSGEPGCVLSAISEYMDRFLVEFLCVNEAACVAHKQ